MLTDKELRNLELTRRWERNWNDDVDRMIDESYAEDCVVVNMFTGHEALGREGLRKVEHAIKAFDGARRMEITNMVASGDVVAVQADAIFRGFRGKAVAFLTFNTGGLIVSDNSYGEDPSGASVPASSNFVEDVRAERASSRAHPTSSSGAETLTNQERDNIDRVKRWQSTWNDAVDRMVDECYAPDCVVVNMLTGHTMHGREELRAIEHAMQAFDGTRKMEITRMVASGDKVAIQMDALWNVARSKACVFLTFNDDGLISVDNSYGQDPSGASTPGTKSFLEFAAS
jgi:hypothetical protein